MRNGCGTGIAGMLCFVSQTDLYEVRLHLCVKHDVDAEQLEAPATGTKSQPFFSSESVISPAAHLAPGQVTRKRSVVLRLPGDGFTWIHVELLQVTHITTTIAYHWHMHR